jgi:hypothetical protein
METSGASGREMMQCAVVIGCLFLDDAQCDDSFELDRVGFERMRV